MLNGKTSSSSSVFRPSLPLARKSRLGPTSHCCACRLAERAPEQGRSGVR